MIKKSNTKNPTGSTRTSPTRSSTSSILKAESKASPSRDRDGASNHNNFSPSEYLKLIDASELVLMEVPPKRKHWGKLIQSNQTGMLYGPRGKGKTWICLAIAMAMASGTNFLGHGPKNRRRVIYMDGEMDVHTFKGRLAKLAPSLKIDVPKGLRIFTPESYAGLLPSVATPQGIDEINRLIGTEWDVLFLDNYSAWSDGRETSESWAPVMKWMLSHKHAGRTVILVHHAGKSGAQRGSSRHEDALDWSIALKPIMNGLDDGSLQVSLEWEKARHLASNETPPLRVVMRSTESGALEWSSHPLETQNDLAVKAKELSAQGMSNAQIANTLGKHRDTIRLWLKPK